MTITIKKDWRSFEEMIPNLYDFSKFTKPPYNFYTNCDQSGLVVFDSKARMVYYPTYNDDEIETKVTNHLEELEKLIKTEYVYLLDVSGDKLIYVYNFSTLILYNREMFSLDSTVIPGNNVHCLAFDRNFYPVRLPKRFIPGVWLLNSTERLLSCTVYDANIDLLFELFRLVEKVELDHREEKDIKLNILPNEKPFLNDAQKQRFEKLMKPVKETLSTDKKLLLSDVIDGSYSKELYKGKMTVEKDMAGFDFVDEIKLNVDTGLLIFYIKSGKTESARETLSEMLGNENFSIIHIMG